MFDVSKEVFEFSDSSSLLSVNVVFVDPVLRPVAVPLFPESDAFVLSVLINVVKPSGAKWFICC